MQTQLDEREPSERVLAVIVTYNIGKAIRHCFDSINNQVEHVIVVDNGSDEITCRELRQIAESNPITLIINDRNEGLAHAYNQAVQWAKNKGFQWILTLDHDSQATPGMVNKLLDGYATLDRQGVQDVGVIGANPYDVNLHNYLFYGPPEGQDQLVEDNEAISSGSLIRIEIFDKVGLFNEDLFIYYVDTDFCKRSIQSGFRVFVCRAAKLLHREGRKTRHKFLWRHAYYDHYSMTARYYIMRNSVYMIKKYSFSWIELYWIGRRLCLDHLKILVFDDERFATLWCSFKGLMDGLRGKVGPMDDAKVTASARLRGGR